VHDINETVLVTGGAGFIWQPSDGPADCASYQVRVLDNLQYGKLEWVPTAAHFM
jgi:hypothetical protein